MERSYIEVTIEADREALDHLVGLLSQMGFEGFWEEENTLRCYMSEHRWSDKLLHETERTVRLIVPSSGSKMPRCSVRSLRDRNWNELWEKTIQPIRVTDRILITPSWHQVSPSPGQIILVIDPKMSFGTGYHETTRLTLRLLERYLSNGMKMLDIGTGTGVLAIAGVRLGASSAVGVDVDEWSYHNACENIERNGVADNVHLIHGSLSDLREGSFDLIAANIQRDVIESMLDDILQLLTREGILLLSGLLISEQKIILSTFSAKKLAVMEALEENEWCAFALKKTPWSSALLT